MSELKFTVESGKSIKLLTGGKYCSNDIIVKAENSSDNIDNINTDFVYFYDYDGTILYKYTLEEAQTLQELPPLPSHDGLICEGWNWTLEDIKQESDQDVHVGAYYITDNGETRFYISVESESALDITISFITSSSDCIIRWGDGVEENAVSGDKTYTHTYASIGDYIISICSPERSCSFQQRFCQGKRANYFLHKIEFGHNFHSFYQYNFDSCKNLTQVLLSSRISGLGSSYAFSSTGLYFITLPSKLTSVGRYAFYGCSSLHTISVSSSTEFFQQSCYQQCSNLVNITIPKSTTSISQTAFSSTKLNKIKLYNTITIGSQAFQTSYAKKVTLPTNITTIPSNFITQIQTEKLTIPDSVETISSNAFSSGSRLNALQLSSNLKSIESNAFSLALSDETYTLPESLESCQQQFSNCLFKYFILPEHLPLISSMFYSCQNLIEFKVTQASTEIPTNCFAQCKNLKHVIIPNGVTTISTNSFYYCERLPQIILPATITSIATNAFSGCYNLYDIYVPWSENEVAGAPWGATYATIHYNSEV